MDGDQLIPTVTLDTVEKIMEYCGVDEVKARFILAVNRGEIPGDVLEGEDASKADDEIDSE